MKVPLLILFAALAVVTAASLYLRQPLMVGAIGIGCALLAAFMSSDYLVRQQRLTGQTAPVILFITFLISFFSIANLPLRFAFALYEERFETMARNLHSGANPDFPCRIGPFFIVEGAPSSETNTIFFVAGGDYLVSDSSERDYGPVAATRLSARWVLMSRPEAEGQ